MKRRPRIRYTEEQITLMWDRYQKGDSLIEIAAYFDRYHTSISGIFHKTGGIRPAARKRSSLSLTLPEREENSRGLVAGLSFQAIAQSLDRSSSTISREINRNGRIRRYQASDAGLLAARWGGVYIQSTQRLERPGGVPLCRYITRPAIAKQRRSLANNGNVIVALKNPYDDGTSHVVLSPLEFVGRLAALVPKPRVNLTRFHGVFSPRSKLSAHVVPGKPINESMQISQPGKQRPYSMTHCSVRGAAFEKGVKGAAIRLEIEKCENCGGKMKIIAGIEDPDVIEKILKHLGLDEASQARNRQKDCSRIRPNYSDICQR